MSEPDPPVYCCIPIEFIQPWDQNQAIRQVKELRLCNMIMMQGTFHVGNSEQDRRKWKELFPQLADTIDAIPRFPERPGHGMCALFDLPMEFRLEQLRLCRELGLKVLSFFPSRLGLSPEDFDRLTEAGQDLVLSECFMGENLSILHATLSLERLRQIDASPVGGHSESYFVKPREGAGPSIFDEPEKLDFRVMHDWFVGRFRRAGEWVRSRWNGRLSAIEASSQMRLAMEAGADVPILELVPSEPLRGLAATRGAARAYGKDLWGVHTAMGYYRAPSDAWTPERLRIAYNLFFAGGASIFSECNMPLRNWGSCSAFFSIRGSPPIRRGELECREFDDPICVRAREVVSEHYRFTQFHQRPAPWPRVRMGYLTGYLDTGMERLWFVDRPGFLAPEAARTWRHFDRAFDSESWYVPPRKYYWQADPAKPLRHGTPPCGQVDIVPIEAPAEALNNYGCLVLLGWNTMTEANYGKLRAYVENGGTLFLSVPHLSTRTRTDRAQEFIRGGDVRDLCGVRILGAGETVEEVYFAQQTRCAPYAFAQGTLYLEEAPLAKLELHGARVLAHPRERGYQPVLLEHPLGKGVVYLLATWEYPGERLDAFLTDILRTLSEGQQGDVAVEGRGVLYSVFDGRMPSGAAYSTVYLVNHDIYGQPSYPRLMVGQGKVPLRVGGCDMRIAWLLEGLVVAPHDRFVKVADARRQGHQWTLTLESAPSHPGAPAEGERLVQIEAPGGSVARVELDGKELEVQRRPEGGPQSRYIEIGVPDLAVRCRLSGRNVLRVLTSD